MKKRKLLTILLAFVLVIAMMPAGALAAPGDGDPTRVIVLLDGQTVNFVDTYARSIPQYNLSYVPIRTIIETLTGEIMSWDAPTYTASFRFNGNFYSISQFAPGITVNGAFRPYDAPPMNIDGKLMIPLRMLSETLGFGVTWEESTRIVRLTSPRHINPSAGVLSVSPRSFDIAAGQRVTVTVAASQTSTAVKITDVNGRLEAESKSFTTSGGNRIYTLTFTPPAAGKYRVYAADNQIGYNMSSYFDFTVQFESAAIIFNAYSSPATVTEGGRVTLYVQTSLDITSLDYYVYAGNGRLNATRQTSGYSDSGGRRTWTNTYTTGTQGTDRIDVTARTRAGTADTRSISLNVTRPAPVPTPIPRVLECHQRSYQMLQPGVNSDFVVVTELGVTRITVSSSGTSTSQQPPVQTGRGLEWGINLNTPVASSMWISVSAYDNANRRHDKTFTFPLLIPLHEGDDDFNLHI